MVFNATFNNISVISWRSVLLVEELWCDIGTCSVICLIMYNPDVTLEHLVWPFFSWLRGRHGHCRMVVEFTTTCATSISNVTSGLYMIKQMTEDGIVNVQTYRCYKRLLAVYSMLTKTKKKPKRKIQWTIVHLYVHLDNLYSIVLTLELEIKPQWQKVGGVRLSLPIKIQYLHDQIVFVVLLSRLLLSKHQRDFI
jgi:hypothetical protein